MSTSIAEPLPEPTKMPSVRPSTEKATAARLETLQATDEQFSAALPLAEVNEAASQPDLSAAQLVEVYLRGYADRPALGSRRYEIHTDHSTGEKLIRYLDSFETITYAQLHTSINVLRARWADEAGGDLRPGDVVATLGYTGVDYAVVDLACLLSGIVSVPMHSSYGAHQIVQILQESAPRVLAVSIESLSLAMEASVQAATVERVIVFDYLAEVDEHRKALAEARARLCGAAPNVILTTLAEEMEAARGLIAPPVYTPAAGEEPLATLIYTSGSTGTPKGVMYSTTLVKYMWLAPLGRSGEVSPSLHFHNFPMSHIGGRAWLVATLSAGGTGFFVTKSDNSTFLEDLALIRPTQLFLVPRMCDVLLLRYRAEVDALMASGLDRMTAEAEGMRAIREDVLGGRILAVACGSAELSSSTKEFMESCLEAYVAEGYGSTETVGVIAFDGAVQRPPVTEYKLVDLPDLGYTKADTPYPRGELYIKSLMLFGGYYKRPESTAAVFDAEGFYKTGDVVAEVEPGRVAYVDRATNIIKLSMVGFVAVSKLESAYAAVGEISQIYVYGNPTQSFLVAVVVPNWDLMTPDNAREVIMRTLQQVAAEKELAPYEVPRDFIIEQQPFSLVNGLLSDVGKQLRPALKAKYEARLESLYGEIAKQTSH